MSPRSFSVESRTQTALNAASRRRKARELDASIAQTIAEIVSAHRGDKEGALRVLIRRGADELALVAGKLDASVCLAVEARRVAPEDNRADAQQRADAFFNLKATRRRG